jgi:phospholipid/cholesterol/gamma-HCH transport system ATP-binding protein
MPSEETKKSSEKNAPPVRLSSLSKSFGQQAVLKGINMEVAEGETLSILGRSGTGKSVLLKLMIGLAKPDSGSIRVHGEEVTNMPRVRLDEVRKKIGFLFQQAALYDSLTVEENVAFPLRRHSKMSDEQRNNRVRELLADVGMDGRDARKLPAEISGGMQKRVGLARALALEPDILLLDEPTAGLDPITAEEIDDLILRLHKERQMASVVVTHDIQAARAVSDRLALLRDGEILIEGTFEDLKKSSDPFVAKFLDGS